MTDSPALATLLDASRAPLSDWTASYPGHRPMGYLCNYVPKEILHAAGYAPLRLRGTTMPLRQVDAHLQSFTCALCRSTLDQLLSGEFDFLAGAVFSHTCDTMQAQADLWRINSQGSHFVDTVMQPANLGAPSARPYLITELRRFSERLASFSGQPISEKALRASISLHDETRRLVQELQGARDQLSTTAFFAVLDAAQRMPIEEVNPLLAELLADLDTEPMSLARDQVQSGPRLLLVGAVLDEPHFLEIIEETGARVAGDDLCSGSRHFLDQVSAEDDPF